MYYPDSRDLTVKSFFMLHENFSFTVLIIFYVKTVPSFYFLSKDLLIV